MKKSSKILRLSQRLTLLSLFFILIPLFIDSTPITVLSITLANPISFTFVAFAIIFILAAFFGIGYSAYAKINETKAEEKPETNPVP
jgi:hypothetical protein